MRRPAEHSLHKTYVFQSSSEWDDHQYDRDEEKGHLLSHIAINRSGKLVAAAMDNIINVFNLGQGKQNNAIQYSKT